MLTNRHRTVRVVRVAGLLLLCIPFTLGGCSFSEAVVDGAYGGVSDTVSSVISEVLLGLLDKPAN